MSILNSEHFGKFPPKVIFLRLKSTVVQVRIKNGSKSKKWFNDDLEKEFQSLVENFLKEKIVKLCEKDKINISEIVLETGKLENHTYRGKNMTFSYFWMKISPEIGFITEEEIEINDEILLLDEEGDIIEEKKAKKNIFVSSEMFHYTLMIDLSPNSQITSDIRNYF